MPGPDDQTPKPPAADTSAAAPAPQDLSKAPWAQPEFLFPNGAKGDFSPNHPPGYTPPPSPAFGHYGDPPATSVPGVPGIDQSKMVFAPPAAAAPGPRADAPTPMPDGKLPPAPAAAPSTGVVKFVKDVAGGNKATGTDYNVGAAPALSTSDDHGDPQTRDRARQKSDDAAAAKANGITPPSL